MARTSIKSVDKKFKDYQFYKEKGWFESAYYYPVKLNILKRLVGKITDGIGTKMAKNAIKADKS